MPQYQELRQFISVVSPLTETALNNFTEIWKPFSAKRKTTLTRAGEVEKYLYFVTDGIQRVFYFDEQQREATIVFTYPHSFCGVADSFLLQTRSRFFSETLTPSTFLRVGFHELNELLKQSHETEHAVRMMTNHAFSGLLERMAEIQCFSAEEKFRSLLTRSPHLLNMIPHKYIANYLGIDASNFSKLLSSIRI